ncbi:MAG: protoglobin domain-containing protein [Deltaproteobacteria bacterium]
METFIEEMKRYLGVTEEDAALMRNLGPRMEKYLPELVERFYAQIPLHPNAFRVISGGESQIRHLKQTLQRWAQRLFEGDYDEDYAAERYQIGFRHVRIGLEQRYVISAMGIVRSYLYDCLLFEFPASDQRMRYAHALGKILDLDLNLICESYMEATLENLRTINEHLERANRLLDEASRSKDEFLALISHELRTPLNSVLGFTKLILDGLTKSPEEEKELLRDVFASAQHLLGLVNDLLDIGRIEAGKVALHLQTIDPRPVIDSSVALIAVQAIEKELNLRDETSNLHLPWVKADEVRMRQVLLNLLMNAVKFTRQGSITLRASLEECPGFLRLEVEDTGTGVPESMRDAVFEKFVQANPSKSRRQDGTGLGLAISKKLVDLMGGSIGLARGTGGRGTLVWFTLPTASGPPTSVARGLDGRDGAPSL